MPRLDELGEFATLERLMREGAHPPSVVVGPGDDAAVLRPSPGMDLVATTDAFVEGRHFLPAWLEPEGRGARLAVANLSDLAAMAATPRWALLSVGARPDREVEDLVAIQRGLARSLEAEGAAVVGGNLTATSGPEWCSLTLLGEVAPGRAWTRRGARPGDLIAVSGFPGRAGAALRLAAGAAAAARAALGSRWPELIEAWLAPRARTRLAAALATSGAVRAAIDVSDGLLGDLGHLCAASGVGAALDAAAGADDAALARAAESLGVGRFELWAGPSDDYELLLAVAAADRERCERAAESAGERISFVGRFTDAPGVIESVGPGEARRTLGGRGFDHFARPPR